MCLITGLTIVKGRMLLELTYYRELYFCLNTFKRFYIDHVHNKRSVVRFTKLFDECSCDKKIGTIACYTWTFEFCDLPVVYIMALFTCNIFMQAVSNTVYFEENR